MSLCIKYFLFVRSIYAACKGDGMGCKAPSYKMEEWQSVADAVGSGATVRTTQVDSGSAALLHFQVHAAKLVGRKRQRSTAVVDEPLKHETVSCVENADYPDADNSGQTAHCSAS